MSEIFLYIIILVVTVYILNSNLAFGSKSRPSVSEDHLTLIEHLTQYSTKKKNYRKTPKNFSSFGYSIHGRIVEQDVFLTYTFPLVDSIEVPFKIKLNAHNVSDIVSKYGCKTSCFGRVDDNHYGLKTSDKVYLRTHMNKDGFYFFDISPRGFGINYNYVIDLCQDLNYDIAKFIEQQLISRGKDSYENRIRAALNFVQFIPYGVPDFDHEEDGYFGLALAYESLAISYCDCDSKSAMFAGILHHLISEQNIILVGCVIDGQGHMITGVAGVYFPGQYHSFQGKDYLLIETTTPIALENQPRDRFKDIQPITIKQADL